MVRIKKIMHTDVPVLTRKAKVSDAAKLMGSKPHGCVVVADGKRPIGVVTELDIVREVIAKGSGTNKSITSIMSSPVTTMTPRTKLEEANKLIDTKKYRKYPVVEGNTLIGLVREEDIVHAISYNMKFHRSIQNIALIIFVLFEFFVIGYDFLAGILTSLF